MLSAKYDFVQRLPGGTNFLFLLKERETPVLWVAKIFQDGVGPEDGCADLNDRAVLAYRLAEMVDVLCIPKMRLTTYSQVEFSPDFNSAMNELEDAIQQDDLLIVRYEGMSLINFMKVFNIRQIRNLPDLIRNFVFNLWIGNYDKKEEDYVVNNKLEGYSIDYSLAGPGFVDDMSVSIGAYFQTYDFENAADAGWAITDPLLEEIRTRKYGVDFFSETIRRIENLRPYEIRNAFEGSTFYRFGSDRRIDKEYWEFLLDRQSRLRDKVAEWCCAGYPKSIRIPEEE